MNNNAANRFEEGYIIREIPIKSLNVEEATPPVTELQAFNQVLHLSDGLHCCFNAWFPDQHTTVGVVHRCNAAACKSYVLSQWLLLRLKIHKVQLNSWPELSAGLMKSQM